MTMKTRFFTILMISIIGYTSTSCNAWLDLQPSDSITEDKLFSTKDGFFQAVNGIYLDLNTSELYGGTLLCSDIEVLAQRYSITSENADMTNMAQYKYKETYPKETFQKTWDKAFSLILTINRIIDNTSKKQEMLGTDYDLLRGELYALRAMLHFDMLRLFGPVMSINPKAKSIPYNIATEPTVGELLPADEIIKKVVADLTRAEVSLASDPIIYYGPLFNNQGSNNSNGRYRTLRLNFYAVKALQARVFLYGLPIDPAYKQKAFEACSKVITDNNAKGWFSFITMADLQASSPNRIFSKEILFMNQNNRRNEIHKNFFDPALTNSKVLAPATDMLSALYTEIDYRYKNIWLTSNEKSFRCFFKYDNVQDSVLRDLVPMIRLSEVYLIAAETAPNPQQGMREYLNVLLPNRGINIVTDNLEQALEREYQREFFGEGQLFYYYKRKNKTTLPGNEMAMQSANYVVPIPDSEMQYR